MWRSGKRNNSPAKPKAAIGFDYGKDAGAGQAADEPAAASEEDRMLMTGA